MQLSRLAAFGRSTRTSDNRFPDPFCDIASMAMPQTIEDALLWAQYIFGANGIYREAVNRVVSYFLTDVRIDDADEINKEVGREERNKYIGFLEDTLGIKDVLHVVAMDYMCYNNSFTSVMVPFNRSLQCPRCGHEAPLKRVAANTRYEYKWQDFKFHAKCPQCKFSGAWRKVDRRSGENDAIRIKRWNPHEIEIIHDEHSDTCQYIWRIPEHYRNQIRQGYLHQLSQAPWEVIEAIRDGQNLQFEDDYIYHMKEDALSGMQMRGWGLPRVIINFRQAYYFALLLRINEAIALDYTIPFRVITPEVRPGAQADGADPIYNTNMGMFRARVEAMLRQRRQDPARWNVLPVPIKYQALGGEASQLAPKDLIEQAIDMLLTSIGVPIELFRGTLSVQAAPAALRLFEANWSHLPHRLNGFISRLMTKISEIMSWEPVHAELERVTVADDLNRQMAKLQLMMGKQISNTSGLSSVGLDYQTEIKQQLEEQRLQAEATQKMQKEMEQAAQMDEMMQPMAGGQGQPLAGGAAPPAQGQPAPAGGGGAAPPAGASPAPPPSAVQQFIMQRQSQPNIPRTPEDMSSQAQLLATDLLSRPESQRRSELMRLKQVDPTMHALVRSAMEDMRQDASAQGGQMVMDQMFPKQGATRSHRRAAPGRYIDLND